MNMNEIQAMRIIRQFQQNNPDGRVLIRQIETAVKGDVVVLAGILQSLESYLANRQDGRPWQRNERIPSSWQQHVTHTHNPTAGLKSNLRQGAANFIKRLARMTHE